MATAFTANGNKFTSDAGKSEWEKANAEYDEVMEALGVDKRASRAQRAAQPARHRPRRRRRRPGRRSPLRQAKIPTKSSSDSSETATPPPNASTSSTNAAKSSACLRHGDSMALEPAKRARPELVQAHPRRRPGDLFAVDVVGAKTTADATPSPAPAARAAAVPYPEILSSELIDTMRAKSRRAPSRCRHDPHGFRRHVVRQAHRRPSSRLACRESGNRRKGAELRPNPIHARSLAMLCRVPRELLEDSLNIRQTSRRFWPGRWPPSWTAWP